MSRSRLTRPLVLLGVVVLLAGVLLAVTVSRASGASGVAERAVSIDVTDGPARDQPVTVDATLFTPDATPAPAVLLAHGFGGTKDSVAAQARQLARDGFVVLTYSARGFGRTTGQIAVNSPDYEVVDAQALLDYLAQQPQVQLDSPGDPRVGVAGGSYGGALSLSLAGRDPRVDAVAASITWNDLGQSLFPELATTSGALPDTPAAGATGTDGVLKRSWAGIFFAAGATNPLAGPCGTFVPEICAAYNTAAETGRPSPELVELLRRSSPVATNAAVRAPTLLVQGQQDTLFGLDQSDANARQIAATGTPVTTTWFAGGHDGATSNATTEAEVTDFLAFHLAGRGDDPGTSFSYQLAGPLSSSGNQRTRTIRVPAYPGLQADDPTPTRRLDLTGPTQPISRPAGASPSSLSTVPGLSSAFAGLASGEASAAALNGSTALDVPGQAAVFRTEPVSSTVTITGSSRVTLEVTGLGQTRDAVLYAKLYDVGADGRRTLPGGGVAAFRVPALSPGGPATPVTVTLPGIVTSVPTGHHLELVVSTTDQAYATPLTPAQYAVALAPGGALTLPSVSGTSESSGTVPVGAAAGIAAILAGLVVVAVVGRLRRRRRAVSDHDGSDVPLVVSGLAKSYADGYRAVDGVDFAVQHGQVLGLLGPNGAGKTTILRMLMGLIAPSSGEIRVFGHRVSAGSPVLSRIGSFVEGSGFLPHLSGAENLRMYWAATGRPAADAHLEEALAIAGLGSAVERTVKSYSQGMRQRLAIAQAMLGLPDLLVLDEPTNGLDPPQIMAMRAVLRDYARTGRTVLVSSHLLSEVEQTCSHVVVVHKGKVVAAGTVQEIVAADGRVVLRVDDADRTAAVLHQLPGVGAVTVTEVDAGTSAGLVQADLEQVPAAEAVRSLVQAGVGVSSVAPRNRLEDVFLALVETPGGSTTPGDGKQPAEASAPAAERVDR
ncbi:alpha/beta fold hydrolase [Rhodococcus sp. X156]|uniref:alpha/beta fold hydrolase n=1 Tax=Rhodococcus sp. X156 TaxID=2499145 RepID=UPI000FD6B9C3|nr:alpha/beta fold hydrolase [Rhodococcus sp. X156]